MLRNPLASSLVTTSIPNQIPNCPSKLVLSGVRLKHGRKLALFTLRARVESVMKCIEKCCEKDWCNLAYKVGAYCYSVQCPDVEACEASKGPGMEISEYILLDRPYTGSYSKFKHFYHAHFHNVIAFYDFMFNSSSMFSLGRSFIPGDPATQGMELSNARRK